MKKTFASLALTALLAASQAVHASSTAVVDFTDLWWNSAESGWGAQVVLQGDVVFLTLFVYDAQRRPVFLVASDMRQAQNVAAGETIYTGALYRTTGPAFTGAFDPARVVATQVGSSTLRFTSPTVGNLSYTVDGTTVTKAITRQTWQLASLAGDYKGGLFAAAANCTGGIGATSISYPGSMRVTQIGNSVEINTDFNPGFALGGSCRYNGAYSQQGRITSVLQGTYSCEYIDGPTPVSGTFEITAIEFGESGFSGVYSGREGAACVHTGRFGGVRRGYADQPAAPETE
jgi:hypothetical protein